MKKLTKTILVLIVVAFGFTMYSCGSTYEESYNNGYRIGSALRQAIDR